MEKGPVDHQMVDAANSLVTGTGLGVPSGSSTLTAFFASILSTFIHRCYVVPAET